MRRRAIGLIGALAALALLAMAATTGTPHASAAPAAFEPVPDWEPTGLTDRVNEFITPASGAFFAVQLGDVQVHGSPIDGFWRSDNAGTTWREIKLPSNPYGVWVDPTDHAIIYSAASPGLYKSIDGGDTWTPLVLTPMLNADGSAYVDELAISPVDHVIYATAHRDTIVQMLLSRDGGLTWDMVLEEAAPAVGCWHGVTFLRAHAVDPARVLRVAGCSYGGAGIANVDVSADQMATWESHGQPSIAGIDTGIFGLIGLEGVRPERLYATTFHSRPTGLGPTQSLGRSVFRSDDEGRTWTQLLSTVKPGVEEDSRSIVGVAYDPRTPDWVFVAMPTGVKLSRDAGRTWSDFRRQDLPEIKSIVVGIDGRNLYAATEKGVFRLNLPV